MVIAAFRCRLSGLVIMRRSMSIDSQLIAMDEAIARPHVFSHAYVRWTSLARTLGVETCTSIVSEIRLFVCLFLFIVR